MRILQKMKAARIRKSGFQIRTLQRTKHSRQPAEILNQVKGKSKNLPYLLERRNKALKQLKLEQNHKSRSSSITNKSILVEFRGITSRSNLTIPNLI